MQRGDSTELLGPFFRLLAQAGIYRWFIDSQRLIYTIVTNVSGPDSRLSFLDLSIMRIIPLSVTTGNVTVSFSVLSYVRCLTVTLIADPDTCPDLSDPQGNLEEELRLLTGAARQ